MGTLRFASQLISAALAALVVLAAPQASRAQTNSLGTLDPATDPLLTSLSPDALINLLAERAQFTGEIISEPGTQPIFVRFTAPTGANVFAGFANCSGTDATAQCTMVEMFTYFDASGTTLSVVNNFNVATSFIATASITPDGRGYLASKTYLNGGVKQANLLNQIGLYFLDIDRLIRALQPGIGTQVSAVTGTTPFPQGSIASDQYAKRFSVNPVGGGIFTSEAARGKILNGFGVSGN